MVAYNWVKSSEMVDLKCVVNISETPIIFLSFSTRYIKCNYANILLR